MRPSIARVLPAAGDAIYAHIVRPSSRRINDSIYISNSGALLAKGGAHDGISAYILGNTSTTFTGADNTITIINTAQIGNSTSYTLNDGIIAVIKKYGAAGTPFNIDPKATASDPAITKNIFSTFSSIREIEIVTDIKGGIAGAYSYVSNSGNLTSKNKDGIQYYAHAADERPQRARDGGRPAIPNSGTITASEPVNGVATAFSAGLPPTPTTPPRLRTRPAEQRLPPPR